MTELLPDFSQLDQFRLLRPEWLLALIPLFLLWLGLRSQIKSQSGWSSVLPLHLIEHLMDSQVTQKKRPPFYLLALAWLLTVFALSGPTWERLPQPVYQLATGKVVVMDMSLSMFATDVKPNRLSRARYKAIDLVNAIKEGETGLIAYAGDAFVISPLTTDSQNLTTLIPSLSPQIMPEMGSDPFVAIELATQLLHNAGHLDGEIFLLTDGVELRDVTEINSYLREYNYRLSVLSVGSETGAPIKLPNGELLKDNKGAIVIPRVEQGRLKNLTNGNSGRYIGLRSDDKDIEFLTQGIEFTKDVEAQEDEDKESFGDQWKEAGPYLILLFLPFAAYAFRRGLILAVGSVLLLQPQQAQADWWTDLWQTKDQQAQKSYSEQAFNKAADQFEHQQWKGSSAYKAEDYESALEHFQSDSSAHGLFNQGNAKAHLNDIDGAIDAYKKALQQQPDFADAQANLELLEQMKQQQEQEQQQEQQQDQQQENQDSEQQDSEQNQDQQDQQSEQQQQQQNSDESEQQDQQQQDSESEQSEQESEEEQQSEEQQQEESEQEAESEEQQMQQPMTQEEQEQQQKLEQWLRQVPDDPALLLRNKMKLEYQQRRRNRVPGKSKGW